MQIATNEPDGRQADRQTDRQTDRGYYCVLIQGFENHVKMDHNMWAYIYYSVYLDQIDVTNHNAIEKYVYEKVVNTRTEMCYNYKTC